jgi:hypothetical protein
MTDKKPKTVVPEEAPSQQMPLLVYDDSKSFHQQLTDSSDIQSHAILPGSRQQRKHITKQRAKQERKRLGNITKVSASELQQCVAAVAKDSKTYTALLALPRLHVQAWEVRCASNKEAEHFVEFASKTAISHIAANYKQLMRMKKPPRNSADERKVMVVEYVTATECLFAFDQKTIYFMTDVELFENMQKRLYLSKEVAMQLVITNELGSESFYIFVVSVGSKCSGFACMGTANDMKSASQDFSKHLSSLIPAEKFKQTCHYRCNSTIVQPCACKSVWYCSKECQKRHWTAEHKYTCPLSKKNKNKTKPDPANHVETNVDSMTPTTSKDIQHTDPKTLETAKAIQTRKARLQEALDVSLSDLHQEEEDDDVRHRATEGEEDS